MIRDIPAQRHALGAPLAALVLVFGAPVDAAASPARHWIDQHEITRLSLMHPSALALLEQGETLAMEGHTEDALAGFQQAGVQSKESALIARRECQALTILGRRTEAIQACLRAVKTEGSAMDMRAMVAALLSGEDPPTPGELAQSMRLARKARDTMPQEPWGYAAECDIAERIADAEMLEGCLANLQRVAPGHYETIRAAAAAAPRGFTWKVGVGWGATVLLGIGTLGHAFWRALRASTGRRRRTVVSAALLVAMGLAGTVSRPAHAQGPPQQQAPAKTHQGVLSDWPVDDNDPESSVPNDQRKNRNPLQFGYWLMDLTFKAVQATKRGDHAAAIKYYKALVVAVPDRSVSFTRLCESYEAAGQWQNALETCATALTRPGVNVQDYQHYFALALAKKGSLNSQEVEVLTGVIQHLREEEAGRSVADDLECQLAVRLEDVKGLEKCTATLAAKAPDDPKTLSYQWALALKRGNLKEAEGLLDRARSTEMKPEGLAQMERGMASFQASRRRRLYAWALGVIAMGLGAVVAVVFARRRRATLVPDSVIPKVPV